MSRRQICIRVLCWLWPLPAIVSGCGGGGTVAPPAVVAAGGSGAGGRLLPNYADAVDLLLHWPRADLRVYVASGTGGRQDLVKQGFALWEKATDERIRFRYVADIDEADIRVRFVPVGSLGARVLAETETTYNARTLVVTRAEITIRETVSGEELPDAAVHEMGHALGIIGHSPDPRDMMYFTSIPPAEITESDRNTLKIGYSWLFGAGRAADPSEGPLRTITVSCPRS